MGSDRLATLALIAVLTLGLSSLFFVTGDFVLRPVFEFLGIATVLLGWFVVAPLYYYLSRGDGGTERERAIGRERGVGSEWGAESEPATDSDAGTADAMAVLKRRYAAGELSEAEFERKVEQLLAVEDGAEALGADGPFGERSRERTGADLELE